LLFCCLQFVASEMYTIEQTIVGSGNCTNLNLQTAAILAAVLPFFGVDRFYLGYIVLGILKLFVFWTLAALTSAGIVFSIFTIRSIRKAEAKKRKATSDKRSKEDKPKRKKLRSRKITMKNQRRKNRKGKRNQLSQKVKKSQLYQKGKRKRMTRPKMTRENPKMTKRRKMKRQWMRIPKQRMIQTLIPKLMMRQPKLLSIEERSN
jgi:hypothetical protein